MTKCKRFIRFNTIISLAFSTASGSLSVMSYSKQVALVFNILLTVFSFTVAVLGSIVKIYQYQERLELYIKTKQDWINLSSVISTELDMVPELRKITDSELIEKYKNDYNRLLQTDYELFGGIKKDLKKQRLLESNKNNIIPKSSGLRIHDILIYIANKKSEPLHQEVLDIEAGNRELETHPTLF